jgi:predicted RNA-binding protein with PUA-like domain
MKYFLAKTDPETYSIVDFAKEKTTTWSGVRNAQAVAVLKSMKKGDKVLIYHSQGESAIRGLATVLGNSRPDPKDTKSWLVDFKLTKIFKEPFITLAEIKKTEKFNTFKLVTQSRLSTMEVPEDFIRWLKERGLNI